MMRFRIAQDKGIGIPGIGGNIKAMHGFKVESRDLERKKDQGGSRRIKWRNALTLILSLGRGGDWRTPNIERRMRNADASEVERDLRAR
jgi:hypothetical protein